MSDAPVKEETSATEQQVAVQSDLLNQRHPLRRPWTLWYLDDRRNVGWLERLHEVSTVDTIEDFWKLVMEVEENKRGGRWLINIERNRHPETIDIIWTELLVAMVGEQFGEDAEHVCGVVCNIRNKGSKISVWTHDASAEEVNVRIGQRIKKVLLEAELPSYVKGPLFDTMRYEVHDDVQQKNSSQIRSKLVISSTAE
uniref:EIF-4F 25 kDa subunit n=1 Tax=Steinernema glaseri TaxID=37863 RepID=A0A1I7YQ89_9BILA